ncbi:MAG: hypothetical protein ABI811_16755 [Acidobacteriota bacterium]
MSLAAEFVTGQGARLVIGQATFTDQLAGASAKLLGGVGGIAFANGKLYLADSNRLGLTPLNNRVLVMDTLGFPKATDEIQPYLSRCPVCVGEASLVLGQPDFTTVEGNSTTKPVTGSTMRVPTAVATGGGYLAVSDTLNNRVLLWRTLPGTNGQAADIVVGQSRLDQVRAVVTDAKSLRAPQGVWIQDGRLFVADAQNHRVLIWNSMPTANDQAADIVLGQNNFNENVELDPIKQNVTIAADSLLTPTSVTSDGKRLFVTDLGLNRVLIWNTIPTRNHQPADVVIGQKDFAANLSNNVKELCHPLDEDKNGEDDKDADGNLIYPFRCSKTVNFPRFALSDGKRLYVADGGNDRVLIYKTIPTENGAAADYILGQPDEFQSVVSSATDLFHPLLRQSAADITATPTSLAWDGTNLYVADPSNRRVLVFTEGEPLIPINGVRNAASREIFSLGSMAVGLAQTVNATTGLVETGKITEGDTVTLTIADKRDYVYTVQKDDTVETIMQGLVNLVNAGNGDLDVFAKYEPQLGLVKIQALRGGTQGDDISISTAVSDKAGIQAVTSGATLQGGENATVIAPGTLVTMYGHDLAAIALAGGFSGKNLPLELGNIQAYFDGIRSPLIYVSPNQVNAQVPFEITPSNNLSFYLRIRRPDGSLIATTAIAVPIDNQNPGIFAEEGADEPRVGIAFHASSYATGSITVDGSIEEGDTATVTISDRKYKYTLKADDTLDSVRDALVNLINSNPEEAVVAVPVAAFHRIQLRAKIAGPAGEGTTFSATSDQGDNNTVFLVLSANSAALCCANVKDARVTLQNPAVPGEMIYVFATGLGPINPQEAQQGAATGEMYLGPLLNTPNEFVSSLASGSTANVISAALEQGATGLYRILLELSPGTIVNSKYAGLTISQFIYTSNTVLVPIRNPAASTELQ